ncbi:DoxX family protein [Collimonas sp. H4R21]|uniref:DoxX family protein n=1 Tax=Collimonas rhizosphaerae TaxID=3126357 RepID=A0ABU9PVJ6_9BURK
MNTQVNAKAEGLSLSNPSALNGIVPAIGRLMISIIFILSGLSKIAAPAMTIGYIQSVGLPFPAIALGVAAFIEIVGGVTLLLGYKTRIVGGVMFLFTLATALFFHNHLADQNQFIHFFKNVAMAGGLLHVIALGGGRISLDGRRS